ncbi:hypothetical protein CHUAL_009594 [Chamberlinius hualienensis]
MDLCEKSASVNVSSGEPLAKSCKHSSMASGGSELTLSVVYDMLQSQISSQVSKLEACITDFCNVLGNEMRNGWLDLDGLMGEVHLLGVSLCARIHWVEKEYASQKLELRIMANKIQKLNGDLNKKKSTVNDSSDYSFKFNLVIHNLKIGNDLKIEVRLFIENDFGVVLKEEKIAALHFLGESRAILLKFVSLYDRDLVLSKFCITKKAGNLKNPEVYITEHFSEETRRLRRYLNKFQLGALKEGKRAFFSGNKLKINGVLFVYNESADSIMPFLEFKGSRPYEVRKESGNGGRSREQVVNMEEGNVEGSLDSHMKTLEGSFLGYKDVAKEVSTLKSKVKGMHIQSAAQQDGQTGVRVVPDYCVNTRTERRKLVEYAREIGISHFSLCGSVMYIEGESHSLFNDKETICISDHGVVCGPGTPEITVPIPKLDTYVELVVNTVFSQSKKLLRTPPGVNFNQNKC